MIYKIGEEYAVAQHTIHSTQNLIINTNWSELENLKVWNSNKNLNKNRNIRSTSSSRDKTTRKAANHVGRSGMRVLLLLIPSSFTYFIYILFIIHSFTLFLLSLIFLCTLCGGFRRSPLFVFLFIFLFDLSSLSSFFLPFSFIISHYPLRLYNYNIHIPMKHPFCLIHPLYFYLSSLLIFPHLSSFYLKKESRRLYEHPLLPSFFLFYSFSFTLL